MKKLAIVFILLVCSVVSAQYYQVSPLLKQIVEEYKINPGGLNTTIDAMYKNNYFVISNINSSKPCIQLQGRYFSSIKSNSEELLKIPLQAMVDYIKINRTNNHPLKIVNFTDPQHQRTSQYSVLSNDIYPYVNY